MIWFSILSVVFSALVSYQLGTIEMIDAMSAYAYAMAMVSYTTVPREERMVPLDRFTIGGCSISCLSIMLLSFILNHNSAGLLSLMSFFMLLLGAIDVEKRIHDQA